MSHRQNDRFLFLSRSRIHAVRAALVSMIEIAEKQIPKEIHCTDINQSMELSSQPVVVAPSLTYSGNESPRSSEKVTDYLGWSIFNTCCCMVFLGIVATQLSLQDRQHRRAGKISTITLVITIMGTVTGPLAWGFLFHSMSSVAEMANSNSNTNG